MMKPEPKHLEAGFTVIEVLFALGLLMMLVAATSNMALGSFKSDQGVQKRNQLTQVMMGMGRRLVAGDALVIPATGATSRNFTAAQLGSLGFQNTANMTAQVNAQNNITYGGVVFPQYQVKVCWKVTTCVKTSVASPEGS